MSKRKRIKWLATFIPVGSLRVLGIPIQEYLKQKPSNKFKESEK